MICFTYYLSQSISELLLSVENIATKESINE